VTEQIRALDELGGDRFHGELYLAEIFLLKDNIDENVVRALLQAVFDPYDLHCFWLGLAYFD
jgi:hypothetical protein